MTRRQFVLQPACTARTWQPATPWRKPFAPRRRFCPAADRRSGARPRSVADRSPFLDAAFHSPAARAGLTACPRGRMITLPAYIFEMILPRFPARSVFRSRPRPAFYCPPRHVPCVNPLPVPASGFAACDRTAAPLRDFSIPRDRNAQPDSNRRSLPLRVARSSFAPRLAKIFRSPQDGSMLQIRYFPPGSLSFEPLGTTLIMHPLRRGVNMKSAFPTALYLYLNHGRGGYSVWTCCG